MVPGGFCVFAGMGCGGMAAGVLGVEIGRCGLGRGWVGHVRGAWDWGSWQR